jgi:A/G-specific adenine glycosylase
MKEILPVIPKKEWIEGRRTLLAWFEAAQRPLPWRNKPEPYPIWLCEIIMQQTRIEQGLAYWQEFLETWPTVEDLAQAPLEEVLKKWQGLGYYSRARNLHKAAQAIANTMNGVFPTTAAGWKALPGVGPYTAAAVSSICFNEVIPAIDGNVLRVLSRYLAITEPIDRPAGRKPIDSFASEWVHPTEPGNHNQALMELGALVCKPRNPDCTSCPLSNSCRSVQLIPGQTPTPPIKAGKTRVENVALTFHVVTDGRRVWMKQRPQTGIWGGLWEFPSTETNEANSAGSQLSDENLFNSCESQGQWGESFIHVLSHRRLHCQFWIWKAPTTVTPDSGQWLTWHEAKNLPIPRALDRFWHDLEKSLSSKSVS